jgi:hypothetical protein
MLRWDGRGREGEKEERARGFFVRIPKQLRRTLHTNSLAERKKEREREASNRHEEKQKEEK